MPGNDTADTGLLVASVREAGAIARHFYGGTYKSWHKSHGNPVTEADIEIDNFLKRRFWPRVPLMAGCRKKPRTIR